VFLQNGKPKLIAKMDKDFCLVGIKNPSRLNKSDIHKEFQNTIWERRKMTTGIFQLKYGSLFKPSLSYELPSVDGDGEQKILLTKIKNDQSFTLPESKNPLTRKPTSISRKNVTRISSFDINRDFKALRDLKST
jgi:hypothetical protein